MGVGGKGKCSKQGGARGRGGKGAEVRQGVLETETTGIDWKQGHRVIEIGAVIELTYNWGVDHYALGEAFGHIALEVENAAAACDTIRQRGGARSCARPAP